MKPDAKIYLLYCLFFMAIFSSCQKENKDALSQTLQAKKVGNGHQPLEPGFVENDMVMYWNEKTATVLGVGMIQPARTRYWSIIQIAVHDALNNIKPKYETYALHGPKQQFASPDAAVATATYWAIKGLNRQGSFPLDTWLAESLNSIPDGESKELGKTLGKQAADAVLSKRANDGFTQVILTSNLPADGDDPGEYRSTLRFVNGVLTTVPVRSIPNWGTVIKPFVVQTNYQFRPAGPNSVSSAEYTTEYQEVKEKGARVGSTRTTQEEMLAKFWAENRPSIIWNNFARKVLETKKMDAWKTARLFAVLHTAMADGINTNIESKYHFYFWRPETAIRLAQNDGNASTIANTDWLPFLNEVPNVFVSPPLPEYPSSFALYGGSSAEILKAFFPDQISVDLTSASLPGTTLHYTSISQAATDNSLSKIWAGWYFRKAVVDGEQLGKEVSQYILQNHFREK